MYRNNHHIRGQKLYYIIKNILYYKNSNYNIPGKFENDASDHCHRDQAIF